MYCLSLDFIVSKKFNGVVLIIGMTSLDIDWNFMTLDNKCEVLVDKKPTKAFQKTKTQDAL